jgi:DNA-binding HxlR family transcriptional regulator
MGNGTMPRLILILPRREFFGRRHEAVGGHLFVPSCKRPRFHARVGTLKRRPSPLSLSDRTAYRRLEDVVGCKWSAAVLAAIGRGVTRPGQLERFVPGISTKVLNERLRKLLAYQLISRHEFPGKILRVEYGLTPTGRKLSVIIEQIRDLDETHAQSVDT